jgi:hypothetical protein
VGDAREAASAETVAVVDAGGELQVGQSRAEHGSG